MYTAVRFQSLGTELRVHGCVRIRLLGYFGPMGISSWRVIPSFLPMLNLELNQIGLSEPVRYSWLGQKSPRPSLEGCGGWVSPFHPLCGTCRGAAALGVARALLTKPS